MANEQRGIAEETIEALQRIGNAAKVTTAECAEKCEALIANMRAARKDEEI